MSVQVEVEDLFPCESLGIINTRLKSSNEEISTDINNFFHYFVPWPRFKSNPTDNK